MNRRTALTLAGTVPLALLAGCLSRPLLGSRIDPEDPPEWPDEPTESAVTSFAARYRAVQAHNEAVDQEGDDWYYRELSQEVRGAFEAKTSAGFVVMTSGGGGSTSVHGLLRDELSSEIILSPEALLVNDKEVIQAPVDSGIEDLDEALDPDESLDPPYSTRGLSLVNFAPENRRVEVVIKPSGGGDEGTATVFAKTFELDVEHGRTVYELLDQPGEYEVSVSVDGNDATHLWTVSDDLREETAPRVGGTHDVALGIYVLPDGTIEIHEIPEERTVERERVSKRV